MSMFYKSIVAVALLLATNKTASAQVFTETAQQLNVTGGILHGTLTVPASGSAHKVLLIIAGSGPTDRNGNSSKMVNNSLQLLAHELAAANIASLRYDKRGVGQSKFENLNEEALRFDDYVNDAKMWLTFLRSNPAFSEVLIAGHSEGSLIGMLAADSTTRFISIAGAGRPAADILKQQLTALPTGLRKKAFTCLDSLQAGKTVSDVPVLLKPLFRPSVQPYLISWFRHDPATIISKFTTAPLIIQGSADLQVGVEDATLLAAANKQAELKIIDKMNHIFRIITKDAKENKRSYNNSNLPISTDLVTVLINFIKTKN
jgi:uncharacterized protein